MATTTLETVQKLIATELDLDPAQLDPGRPLTELGIDSLTVMECLFKIEDEFKISVEGSNLAVSTLQDIADLVDSLVRAKAPGPA
jgi:acyl carrier protein